MMKHLFLPIILFLSVYTRITAQEHSVFPRGQTSEPVHHTGTVWLNELNHSDSIFSYSIAHATFNPGSRLDWHTHPGGQILMITSGTGFYQEKGKPKQTVRSGEVVKCVPGIEHWHGATPDSEFSYLATTPTQKGRTVWLHKVSDEEYFGPSTGTTPVKNPEQELISLSREKWRWMADRNVDTLAKLFDEKAIFVHMGGTMTKDQELGIIKSGGIHYKQADIEEVSVKFIDNTAILLNKIRLLAVVGGKEVINPFSVTEVYVNRNGKWMMGSMSFTKLITPQE